MCLTKQIWHFGNVRKYYLRQLFLFVVTCVSAS